LIQPGLYHSQSTQSTMSAIISSKQMEKQLYNLVSALADNYGFDADEAFDFARWETETDHVGELLKTVEKSETKKNDVPDNTSETTTSDPADKIAVCRKNIELWKKKLSDGTAKDSVKQADKIAKEEAKLAKLLEKVPAAKAPEKKPVTKTKKEEKPEAKPEVKEKRIKRFSPVMAAQLKTAFEAVKMESTDKMKKEFQQYVEDLTDEDFRKESLSDHMRAFVQLKVPTEEESEDSEPETVVVKTESKVLDVTLKELQSIAMTATVDPPGTFWDADNGRFVKGPDSDDDEDFEEITFENTKYVVGEKTGRVYEARDTGDVFAGFIGVGKFKKMTK
jgi:hypothetical protein